MGNWVGWLVEQLLVGLVVMEVLVRRTIKWGGFGRIRVVFDRGELKRTWDVGVQKAGGLLMLDSEVVEDSVVGVRQRWVVRLCFVVDLDGGFGGGVAVVEGGLGIEVIFWGIVDRRFDAFDDGELG